MTKTVIYSLTDKNLISYPLISKILDKVDSDIVDGPWIAGGAGRFFYKLVKKYNPNPPSFSDIDFFCRNLESNERLQKALLEEKFILLPKIPGGYAATFYEVDTNTTVQIIDRFFEGISDLFEDFDFTVCQFVMTKNYLVTTSSAVHDLENMQLSFSNKKSATLQRIEKYNKKYGFRLNNEIKQYIRDEFNL